MLFSVKHLERVFLDGVLFSVKQLQGVFLDAGLFSVKQLEGVFLDVHPRPPGVTLYVHGARGWGSATATQENPLQASIHQSMQ